MLRKFDLAKHVLNLPLSFDESLLVDERIRGVHLGCPYCILENHHTDHQVDERARDHKGRRVISQRDHIDQIVTQQVEEEDYPGQDL